MPLEKFCPKCGKKGITGEFCSECSPDKELEKDIENTIKACTECRKYFQANKWHPYKNISNALSGFIKSQFEKRAMVSVDAKIPKHTQNPGVNIEFDAIVTINSKQYELPFKISYTLCPKCSKKNTQYFEGVLQLRNSSKEAVMFVKKKALEYSDKGVFINNIEKVKGGFDFYITKNNFTKKIAELVIEKFGGVLKISRKTFSRDFMRSKDIYRMNVLVKLPDFFKGDVLLIKKKLFRVISLGKKAAVFDISSQNKKKIDYDIDYNKIKKFKTKVAKIKPELEVFNPETFQPVEIRNRPVQKQKLGAEVSVVEHDGFWYIV